MMAPHALVPSRLYIAMHDATYTEQRLKHAAHRHSCRVLPNICESGDAKKDMAATHSGVPANMTLVPTGGSATCLRKKMGKNLMVIPDAKPNRMSEVARM